MRDPFSSGAKNLFSGKEHFYRAYLNLRYTKGSICYLKVCDTQIR